MTTLNEDFDRLLLISEYIKSGISKEANKEYTELVIRVKNSLFELEKHKNEKLS